MSSPVYNFKQAATFGKGLTYAKGTHRVAPGVSENPYFQKLVTAGLIVQAGSNEGASEPTSIIERQKKAIDSSKEQSAAKAKAKAAPAKEEPAKAPKKARSK